MLTLRTTIEFITDSYLFTFSIVQRISEKQMFALSHTQLSLLLRAGDHWWVSCVVGVKDGWLKAEVVEEDPLVPPINGWSYLYTGGLSWWNSDFRKSDETLECSRTVSAVCVEVRI